MDVLRTRYASEEMVEIWDQRSRIATARQIWLAVMEAQHRAGIGGITDEHLDAYRRTENRISTPDHLLREETTRHETKAWIEVWDEQAGSPGKLHLGLTSSDITENVAARQVVQSVELLVGRVAAVLSRLHTEMRCWQKLTMVGRTHNLPAQPTTLGKRYAVCASELLMATNRLHLAAIYPARGIGGAVGTNSDMLALAGGDRAALRRIQIGIADVGINCVQVAVGQTPPRSIDLEVASTVTQVCAAVASMAVTIRLMVGQGLATETGSPGQVGSSAMPHKVNPRYAERVSGLLTVVRGFASMLTESAGQTWNEGDVSDSATRRVAWPGLFMAADGLLRTFMVALQRFEPDEIAIAAEVERYQWELATGRLVAALVDRGWGREDAHRVVATPTSLWSIEGALPAEEIQEIIGKPDTGDAVGQVDAVCDWVSMAIGGMFEQSGYDPGVML